MTPLEERVKRLRIIARGRAEADLDDYALTDALEIIDEIQSLTTEKWMRWMLQHRGVEEACKKCGGSGKVMYGSTSTWRGGIGGSAMTSGVCDSCWGSGCLLRKGTDLRQLEAQLRGANAQVREQSQRIAELEKELTQSRERSARLETKMTLVSEPTWNERFEIVADLYYRRYRRLAPGKSEAMETGRDSSSEENRAQWETFQKTFALPDAVARIAELEGQLAVERKLADDAIEEAKRQCALSEQHYGKVQEYTQLLDRKIADLKAARYHFQWIISEARDAQEAKGRAMIAMRQMEPPTQSPSR